MLVDSELKLILRWARRLGPLSAGLVGSGCFFSGEYNIGDPLGNTPGILSPSDTASTAPAPSSTLVPLTHSASATLADSATSDPSVPLLSTSTLPNASATPSSSAPVASISAPVASTSSQAIGPDAGALATANVGTAEIPADAAPSLNPIRSWLYTAGTYPDCTDATSDEYDGAWITFSDDTADVYKSAQTPGRGGDSDCAMRLRATDLTDWGGGGGFNLNWDGDVWGLYDVSDYAGVRIWLKGTTKGSYSDGFVGAPNMLRIQVKSGYDGDVEDWGFFCEVNADSWTLCESRFDELTFEHRFQPYQFDASKLRGFGFAIASPDLQAPVSFDVWIDDMGFF
jgi:hypothetical protein